MYSPYSDLEKMFWTPNYILFRCLIDGKEYFGRPKDIHMGDVSNQKFRHCSFQYWDSFGQYLSGTMPRILEEVTTNRVIGLEAIDSLSNKEPSTLSQILSLCNEIAQIPEASDIGIMRNNIPAILDRLLNVIEIYSLEHPKAYTKNSIYSIDELKTEFENIDDSLKSEQYRKEKIVNLKEKLSQNIHWMFSRSEDER